MAAELGSNVTSGTVGQAPAGDIVVLAVPFDAAKEIVSAYGAALAGKTVVDITNPVNFETFDSLVVAPGTSAAEEIAALTPGNVVKAFNTTFAGALVAGETRRPGPGRLHRRRQRRGHGSRGLPDGRRRHAPHRGWRPEALP